MTHQPVGYGAEPVAGYVLEVVLTMRLPQLLATLTALFGIAALLWITVPAAANAAGPTGQPDAGQAIKSTQPVISHMPWPDPVILQWQRASGSGKCVDVVNSQTHSGAGLSLYNCHGYPNQQWRYGDRGVDTYHTILSWDGRCLDTHQKGTGDRTRVVVSTCDGTDSQLWEVDASLTGAVQVKQRSSQHCLEVYASRNTNGNAVEISNCTKFADQRFIWQDWARPW